MLEFAKAFPRLYIFKKQVYPSALVHLPKVHCAVWDGSEPEAGGLL